MNNTSPIGQEYNYKTPTITGATYNLPFINPLQADVQREESRLLTLAMKYPWVEDYCYTSRFKGIRGNDENPYGFTEEELSCQCENHPEGEECPCDNLPSASNRFDIIYDIYATQVYYLISLLYSGTKEVLPNAEKVKSKEELYDQMQSIFYFKEYLQMHRSWFYHCVLQNNSYPNEFEEFIKWCYTKKFAGEEPFIKQKLIIIKQG